MSNILIAFYSRAAENYVSGELKQLTVGNTEKAAKMIAEQTGGDLLKIEQCKPYAESYNDCIARAQSDQRRNARPELKNCPDNIDKYDVVYLGYPNYWGTMPMAVFTFLERFDFSGKVIRPFCTHEGSGLGSSEKDIKNLCPAADIKAGLAIHGGSVDRAADKIKQWTGDK